MVLQNFCSYLGTNGSQFVTTVILKSHDQKESNLNSGIITNSGADISADRKIRKKYIQ